MSLEQTPLTIASLCDLLENTRKTFGNVYYPFGIGQRELITKCSEIAGSDFKTWQKNRNTTKTRAHRILNDVARHKPELFVLLALSITPTRLGTLKSKDYLRGLIAWWEKVDHPRGLKEAVKHHASALPTQTKNPKGNTCQGQCA